MGGVIVGTRLEQLRDLRRRLDLEIEQEQRKALEASRARPIQTEPPAVLAVDKRLQVQDLLQVLGVNSHQVKVWACNQGLIPEVKRGRISRQLVEAYSDSRAAQRQAVSW